MAARLHVDVVSNATQFRFANMGSQTSRGILMQLVPVLPHLFFISSIKLASQYLNAAIAPANSPTTFLE